jgi:hypothetical protein
LEGAQKYGTTFGFFDFVVTDSFKTEVGEYFLRLLPNNEGVREGLVGTPGLIEEEEEALGGVWAAT